ncbi:kinase-like domain-containing protein [Absidia repens]|uniref:Kinase-like domain-containing protein n=1 Tax=Absidia repens TaxID=90262 RepID=A0A1X2J025_9FUNG|nr:kinase-like domain-containing protein [Absidia repens]
MYKRKSRPTSFSHADRICDQLRVEQQQSNLLAAKIFLETSLDTKLCEDLHKELQDGVILCRLINCMKPGAIASIGRKNIPFVKMANISLFLQGAKDLGLQNSDLFQTVDLYEAKDMAAVINTILTFARICNKDGKSIESFGNYQKQNRRQSSTTTTAQQKPNQQQPYHSTHRHVKNIFQQQQHLSPDITSHHQLQSPKCTNGFTPGGTDAKVEGSRHTYSHLTQKSTRSTESNKKQLPMTNDSGYGSLTRHRQNSNSTPTQIMDALYDDENEGNDYRLHEGRFGSRDQQQASSHLQVHGGPCIIRKRFSQTSLNMDPSLSPPPQRPTLPTKVNSESVIDSATTLPPYPVPIQSTPSVAPRTLSASPLPLLPKKNKDTLSSSIATTIATATTPTPSSSSSLFGRTSTPSYSTMKQHRTNGLDSNGKQSRRVSNPVIGTAHSNIDKNGSVGIKDQRRLTVRISLKKRGKPTKRSTHFLLGDCVGKGQFGSVYRALDMHTGEIVAVKRISVEDTQVEDDIMQEINLLRGMTCPHIVRYIGFAQDEIYMNIVLEYVENGSLLSTLKAFGSLPEKLVGSYTYKILKGLEYLHSHDVVHCDLKAANILTTKTGDIKLTDFGVSLNLKIKQEDGKGTPAGTPNWMAPEVIEMKGACYKSDIWSLACTITELLTGKPPYADLISMSALYHIVEDDCPPLPENISNDLRDFLLLCFRKDPELRPTASELLHHPWLQSIKSEASQPTSPMDTTYLPNLDKIDEKNRAPIDCVGNKANDSFETTVCRLIDQQQLQTIDAGDTYEDADSDINVDDDTNSQVTILTCDNNYLDLIGKPGQHVFTRTRLENLFLQL